MNSRIFQAIKHQNMNPILRNVLAVIAGVVVGSIVNMGIIQLSGQFVDPPQGVDVTDVESLKANIHLFNPIHFVFPFLAHAIGTLVGAYLAARIAGKMNPALFVGGIFLLGGVMMVVTVGGPMWFNVMDLVLAYIPMAWLGGKMALGRHQA